MVYEVKFCPALAQLREVMRTYFTPGDSSESEIYKSFTREKFAQIGSELKRINICDTQLFICMLFYNDQSLWSDECALYRALWSEDIRISDRVFVELTGYMRLLDVICTRKLSALPLAVQNRILSLIETHHPGNSHVFHDLLRNLIQGRFCTEMLWMVEDIWSSADIDTLADTLSWLRSGSECCQSMSSTTEQNFIYEYARTQNSRKLEEIALEYEDCVTPDETITLPDVSSLVKDILSEMVDEHHEIWPEWKKRLLISCTECVHMYKTSQRGDENIKALCECYLTVTERLISMHQIQDAISQRDSSESGNLREEELSMLSGIQLWVTQAEDELKGTEGFMLSCAMLAAASSDSERLKYLVENIGYYTSTHNSVRDFLVSEPISWSEDHVALLLDNLNSAHSERKTKSDHNSTSSLQKIVISALTRQHSTCKLLTLDYLRPFSDCFTENYHNLINLNLNHIRPGQVDIKISNTLAILLSIHPSQTMKLFTNQLLNSKAALANAMSQVYLQTLITADVSIDQYESWISDLDLSEYEIDDIISQSILYINQGGSRLMVYLLEQGLDKLSLSNTNLVDMMRNIETSLIHTDTAYRVDNQLLFSLGLFTLNVIDSLLAVNNPTGGDDKSKILSGEDNSTLRLCQRVISTPQIEQALSAPEHDEVSKLVLQSLHPTTRQYLIDQKAM